MKADYTTKLYLKHGIKANPENVNKYLKAIIINFGDSRGDIIVENDNFNTNRKYADFTKGKRKAGLHPMQIVFFSVTYSKACHDRYIGKDNQIYEF